MSDYKNFVRDFPDRCRDILLRGRKAARRGDREVTLMLMAAASGLIVPYERLKPEGIFVQPTQDRTRFSNAAEQLKRLLNGRFLGSKLWPEGVSSWATGELQSVQGTPDQWPELRSPMPVPDDTLVSSVVEVLRHALAHGNLFTKASGRGQIGSVVFVSGGLNRRTGRITPYRYVSAAPEDLEQLLLNWFDSLEALQLPEDVIATGVDEAA